MDISKKLWEDNHYLAEKSIKTKFVQSLKNGTLPKEKFKLYVAQDSFFLECFARSYGLAISKALDKQMIKILSQLLIGVSEELMLHDNYAQKWGVNLKLNKIEVATKNYTDFLTEVSQKNNLIEIMCAMAPCMRLYAWIGKSLANNIENNAYKEWIETYSDVSFENLAKTLEKLINESNKTNSISELNFFYKKAMELEFEFFNAFSDF